MLQTAMAKHHETLHSYVLITNDNIGEMKKGGYVKYFNNNFILKHGGIVVSYQQHNDQIELSDKDLLFTELFILLKNSKGIYKIKFIKNYIFYMKHRTANEKLRSLFIKAIE